MSLTWSGFFDAEDLIDTTDLRYYVALYWTVHAELRNASNSEPSINSMASNTSDLLASSDSDCIPFAQPSLEYQLLLPLTPVVRSAGVLTGPNDALDWTSRTSELTAGDYPVLDERVHAALARVLQALGHDDVRLGGANATVSSGACVVACIVAESQAGLRSDPVCSRPSFSMPKLTM